MAPEARVRDGSRNVSASCSALLACLMALALAACAGPAAPPALGDAHAAVERARSTPRVRALAPDELDLAESALEQAVAAARAGAPRAQIEHLAYVAGQRAAFAEARAAAEVARSETRLLRRALGPAAIEARVEGRHRRAPSREDQDRSAPVDAQTRHAAVAADREIAAAEPDPVTPDVETLSQDLALSLAELPFEEAEPTEKALERLAELAERLLREPARGLLIEADFGLPEPAARTLVERRVEVVRAFFLERGVAPARLVVHASGERPEAPPPSSPDPTA
jgi:outer membrane protein OmpA-like peptidoglycan-associated protein